jgi:hypothetical protein
MRRDRCSTPSNNLLIARNPPGRCSELSILRPLAARYPAYYYPISLNWSWGRIKKKKKGRYIPRLRGTSSFETRHGASRSQMPSGRQRSLTSPPVDHLLEAHAHILGDLETHAGNDAFPQLPASPLMYRSLTSDGDREIELRDGGGRGAGVD